jgi:nicotinamidase-related amidase
VLVDPVAHARREPDDFVDSHIRALLDRARAAGIPVIYIQDDDVGGGPGQPGWEIHPAITPEPGELTLRKPACDSFYATAIEAELRARGVKKLVVAGMKTQACVDTTCRRATSLGFDVDLVGDAHTTTDCTLSAEQIIVHTNRTLDGFGTDSGVICVKSTGEVVF